MLLQILFRSMLRYLLETVLRTYFKVTGVVRNRFRPGSLVDMVNLIIQDHSSILSSISLEKESYRIRSYVLSSLLSALPLGAMQMLLSIQVTDRLRSTVASGVMGRMCFVMYQILTSAYHNDFPSINENGTFIVENDKTTNKQAVYFSIWSPSEDRSVCASAQPDQSSLFT